jgi:protease-4
MMQAEVDAIYQQFLLRVTEGRHLSKRAVQNVARGRVWSGASALKCKLVDALGGLNATIKALQKEVGTKAVVYYPKKEDSTFNTLVALLDEELDTEKTQSKSALPTELLRFYEKFAQIKKMKGLQMRVPFMLYIR